MNDNQNDPGDACRRWLYRQRWEHERAVAAQPRQGALPFVDVDSYLADETPGWHGTNVGLQRHVDAGEAFCGPCQELLDELAAAGLVRERQVGER